MRFKAARRARRLTQVQAARALGVSQPYLSLMERGRRPVPRVVAKRAAKLYKLPGSAVPLPEHPRFARSSQSFAAQLGNLGYPGFAHLAGGEPLNPAEVLLSALGQHELESRMVEALPWLVWRYELDWEWTVRQAKLNNLQNRLGFTVTLAHGLAQRCQQEGRADELFAVESELEKCRLAREDTLCHASLTRAEIDWLRENRSKEARHWGLLTDLTGEQLQYAQAS